jgi:hypothetical protein
LTTAEAAAAECDDEVDWALEEEEDEVDDTEATKVAGPEEEVSVAEEPVALDEADAEGVADAVVLVLVPYALAALQ